MEKKGNQAHRDRGNPGRGSRQGKSMIIYGLVLLLLCFSFPISGPFSAPTAGAASHLSLEEAVFHTKKNSSGLRDATVDRIKKTAERKEAVEAVRMARRREKYPWFTLLMNVNLPQKHGLPKEIELLMKLPEVNTELQTLRKKEEHEVLKARHDATLAYLDVLLARYHLERKEKYLRETEEALTRIRRQYLIGRGDKEDVDYLEEELESLRGERRKAVQDLETQLDKLGRLTNLTLNTSTRFDDYLPQADIDRRDLDNMVEHAVQHDFDLFQATQDRKIAQTEVLELIKIYENQWGGRVRSMTNYIKSQLGRQVEKLDARLDYDHFMNNFYEPALDRIEAPWRGSYRFRILFVTIRIPKEWFKLGTLGERYFEDEQYALFTALVDREKAIDLENDIREDLIQQVKDTYRILKQMEQSYEETQRNQERSEGHYQHSLRQNQIGLLPFQELHSEKMNFYGQEDSLFEMRVDYGKAIATLNLYSSGYLDVLEGTFETTDLFDGDSFLLEDVSEPGWFIQTLLSDYKFTFGVNIPDEYGLTDFELYTANHERIGAKTQISDTVSHLPVIFEDTTMLYVKLYDDDELKYIAELDGFDIYGPLDLKEADQFELVLEEEVIGVVGAWSATRPNDFQAFFEFDLDEEVDRELAWDQYGLYYTGEEERLLGGQRFDPGQPLRHLPGTFSDPDLLLLKLFQDGDVVSEFNLDMREDELGLLIDPER